MTVIKNFFILEKEQRAFTHLVKNKIYQYNGILYGDIVINTILVKYFKNEFINNKNNFSDYWNEKIDEKTKLRTLTSNKIDVYFKNLNDYVNFIEYLKSSLTLMPSLILSLSKFQKLMEGKIL